MRTTDFIYSYYFRVSVGREGLFDKKDRFFFFLKFIGVLIATVVFGFMLKFLMSVGSGPSLTTAKELTSKFGVSFTVVSLRNK